ncbi:agamous-like MADS-box protein AGL27 [Lactuca sativa]|nr:agamous-like MADS-box protein AGL27 [Lactuca sativa]
MGRRKLEMKRIEDKSSRQVTFSKRRSGLNKKARQLSILCDAAVAVVVFSSNGKLYEYCSGGTNRVEDIISRYHKSSLDAEERTTQEGACQNMGINNTCTRFQTCNELLHSVRRLDEKGNVISVSDMTELEEELSAALMHTRARKTQLMMERISSFHEQERKLSEEKEELKQQLQVASAANPNDDVDVGGQRGRLEDTADNQYCGQTTPPRRLITLPLFKD